MSDSIERECLDGHGFCPDPDAEDEDGVAWGGKCSTCALDQSTAPGANRCPDCNGLLLSHPTPGMLRCADCQHVVKIDTGEIAAQLGEVYGTATEHSEGPQ